MKIPENHLAALVKHFQAGDPILEPDGIYGPRTAAALDLYIADNMVRGGRMRAAFEIARSNIGYGGEGGNNKGPYIRGLRAACGFPVDATGAWCAIFASAMLLNVGIPAKSRGAYRLTELLAGGPGGYDVATINDMVPGDVYLVSWARARWATHREAHVRFLKCCADDLWTFVGGNERGDKVRGGVMTRADLESETILKIAGCTL